VPPGYRSVPTRGIDSYVGQWRSGESRIAFDLGWYSSRLLPSEEMHSYQSCVAEIGGKPARMVSFWSRAQRMYFVGAHWVVQEGDESGQIAEWRPTIYLTVYAMTPTAREADLLRRVLWSVQFDQ
jgi:hypothetical protein